MADNLDFDALNLTKIKDGLSLRNLIEKGEEFTLEPDEENMWGEPDNVKQVETLYEYEDFEKHINLDCIQCDPDDVNSAGTPFDKISVNMTNVTEDGKLKKQILRSGTTKIPEGAIVYLHYNKYLEMQEVPFDSSYLRNKEPARYQMGCGSHYLGFEKSIMSMCVGEKSQFLIHHDLAYGKLGSPPRIPPAATILLVVEVFKAVDCGQIKEEEPISLASRKEFATAYKLAKQAHERANDYFCSRNVSSAVEYYRRAENLLVTCSINNDEEEKKMKHLLLKIYVNMTVCFNTDKMKQPERLCVVARKAFELDPVNAKKSAKLYYNRGLANQALNNYKQAAYDFDRALRLEPKNEAINKAIRILDEKRKRYLEFEKGTFQKMFGFAKNEPTRKEDLGEVDEECRKTVTEILEDFAKGTTASLQLSSGFTFSERKWIKRETDRLGLIYEDSVIAGRRDISVKKKF